jgi:hypothetical protein
MTVNVAGQSHVLRTEATAWATIPGGSEAEIGPGDAWLYHNVYDDNLAGVANVTSRALRFLWVPIWDMRPECSPAGPSVGYRWSQADLDKPLDADEPVRIRARTLTFPPGSSLPADVVDALTPLGEEELARGERRWVRVESGRLDVVYLPSLPDDTLEPGIFSVEAGGLLGEGMPLPPTPDLRLLFQNGSDSPLELLVFEVIVGGPDALSGIPAPLEDPARQ